MKIKEKLAAAKEHIIEHKAKYITGTAVAAGVALIAVIKTVGKASDDSVDGWEWEEPEEIEEDWPGDHYTPNTDPNYRWTDSNRWE